MISPIIMTLMLTVLLVSIVLNLNNVIDDVDHAINDLAPDTDTASKMMDKVYGKRLQVKNYIKTSKNSSKEQFSQLADELKAIISKAKLDITNPSRTALINEIETLNNDYDSAFYKTVVTNMDIRNEIVTNTMNIRGPSAEKHLSRVMKSAYQDGDAEAAYFVGEALKNLLLARIYAFKYLDDNSDASKSRTFDELVNTKSWIKKLQTRLENRTRQQSTTQALNDIKDYEAGFEKVITAIETRNNAINTILDIKGPLIAKKAVDLKDNIFDEMLESGVVAHDQLIRTEFITLIVYIFAAVVGLLISNRLAKQIVKPLSQLSDTIGQVAKGNLMVEIDIKSKDEIGCLAEDFKQFVSELKLLISEIAHASDQLSQATTETSLVSQETSTNIVEQQHQTTLVATAINQLAAAVSEVASNTEQASTAAANGDIQAKSGKAVITEIVKSIERLVLEISSSSEVIEMLKSESNSIGTVLDVIKSIAEQTNLLALNAAIEAARAGEQGRGFAVVADEVRSLAQKTQDSTKQIEQLISNLQTNADNAVNSMSVNKDSVSALANKTSIATESLDTISNVVSSISDMNSHIATATQQQSNVVEEVNQNIHAIQSISDNTSIASEKVLKANTELSELSRTLRNQIMKFKIT